MVITFSFWYSSEKPVYTITFLWALNFTCIKLKQKVCGPLHSTTAILKKVTWTVLSLTAVDLSLMPDILFCFNTVSSTSDFLILPCDVKYQHLRFVNAASHKWQSYGSCNSVSCSVPGYDLPHVTIFKTVLKTKPTFVPYILCVS